MHLNDDEILELSEQNKLHLEHCSSCRKRADNLTSFRESLSKLPVKKLPNSSWEDIKLQYEITGQQNEIKEYKNRVLIWRHLSVALAASLLLVVIVYEGLGNYSPNSTAELEIANLIEQNQLLQEALFISMNKTKGSEQGVAAIRYKINILDTHIQNAYLQNSPTKEISQLWARRLITLNEYLIHQNNSSLLKI